MQKTENIIGDQQNLNIASLMFEDENETFRQIEEKIYKQHNRAKSFENPYVNYNCQPKNGHRLQQAKNSYLNGQGIIPY